MMVLQLEDTLHWAKKHLQILKSTPLPTPTLVGPNSISREKEDKDWEETKMSSLQVFCQFINFDNNIKNKQNNRTFLAKQASLAVHQRPTMARSHGHQDIVLTQVQLQNKRGRRKTLMRKLCKLTLQHLHNYINCS